MLVKVKHEELNNFAKDMEKNSGDLQTEIEKMLGQLDDLKNFCQGQYFDTFYESLYNYLNKMKDVPHAMNVMGEFTKRCDIMYMESDLSFAKQLQQEVNYDE